MHAPRGIVVAAVIVTLGATGACDRRSQAGTAATEVAVTFSGGHATDARDAGRPVVLVAAALGVPTEVFRTAFSRVQPAAAGQSPQVEQVGRNKAALLAVLTPYGVTNAALDAASDTYRYNGSAGGMWPTRPASAVATVVGHHVTRIRVIDGGSGYTSPPDVLVPGATLDATAVLAFGSDIAHNGAVASVRLKS